MMNSLSTRIVQLEFYQWFDRGTKNNGNPFIQIIMKNKKSSAMQTK